MKPIFEWIYHVVLLIIDVFLVMVYLTENNWLLAVLFGILGFWQMESASKAWEKI